MHHRWLLAIAVAVAAAFGATGTAAQSYWPTSPIPNWPTSPYPNAFYMGIEGGWSALISTKTHVPGRPTARESFEDGDWNYADHLVLGLRAGFQWGPWGIEEEGSYRHNKVFRFADMPFSGSPTRPWDGQRNAYALMTNVIYTYALPNISLFNIVLPWSLHAGAGVGPLYVIDRLAANPNSFGGSAFGPGVCCLHGGSWNFGYQGLAGARFEITPNILLDIDYRYIGMPGDLSFKNKGAGAPLNYKITGAYQSTDSFFSLIMRF